MKLTHIISARQFDKKNLDKIFEITDRIKQNKFRKDFMSGRIMATLFYEPSTRTRLSFESAMIKLGGKIITTENAAEFSSVAKGENLQDTIRVVHSFCDVIVLRHSIVGASKIAAEFSKVPIINAGDGEGEHPTQAILDLYTIFSKYKKGNFTIAMVGDLKNGRTIHSLSLLLSLYQNIKIIFVSPKALAIPKFLKEHLDKEKIKFDETESLNDALKQADIIYQTRIQKERFRTESDYSKYFGRYIIDQKSLKLIKTNAKIMHPLPRINEISPQVDSDQRAIYFEQAQNGVYTRMAILMFLFDNQ